MMSQREEAAAHAHAASLHAADVAASMRSGGMPLPRMHPDVVAEMSMREGMMDDGMLPPHMRPDIAADLNRREAMMRGAPIGAMAAMAPGDMGGGFNDAGSMRPSVHSGRA
jgi:hypothetical protein